MAGIDFFTVEVLTWRGLVTDYILFVIHLESRRVSLAGITRHPDKAWMEQMARNATDESWGFLDQRSHGLHDRDTKFCGSFQETLASGGIKPIQLPARRPNLNAYAERWVRSVKDECLGRLILFGESSLRRALTSFIDHFHCERNHQGKGNVLLFAGPSIAHCGAVHRAKCRELLGACCGFTLTPHGFLALRGLVLTKPKHGLASIHESITPAHLPMKINDRSSSIDAKLVRFGP